MRTISDMAPQSGDTISIPGRWSLWRWATLRGAGFPCRLVLDIASPELASSADELLQAEAALARARTDAAAAITTAIATADTSRRRALARIGRRIRKGTIVESCGDADVDRMLALLVSARRAVDAARDRTAAVFEHAAEQASVAIRRIATNARFREALLWQNRAVLDTALAPLLARHARRTSNWHDRQHEELVANYLHRYCTKNDQIGFFGPTGFARVDPGAPPITVTPGPGLVSHDSVYFEQWGIDVLAAKLSSDPRIRPAIAPRRYGFVRLDGATAHSALSGAHALAPAEAIVLAACDGTTSAAELAAELPSRFPAELGGANVDDILAALCEKQLLAWDLQFAIVWEPETELRRRLEQLPETPARSEALAALAELAGARAAVADASGQAAVLRDALARLDETFTRITGANANRHAGAMYSSRMLLFTDSARDLELVVGGELVADLAPALSLVLQSGRWLTAQVAAVYRAAFAELHAEIARRTGSVRVPFAEFWFQSKRLLIQGAKDRPLDAVARALSERWASVLTPAPDARRAHFSSSELAAKIDAAFAADAPGWSSARYHSPDLLVAAASVDAIRRGDYTLVLGEIHFAINTLRYACTLAQLPVAGALQQAFASDGAAPRVRVVRAKDVGRFGNVRLATALVADDDHELEAGFEGSTLPRERVLRVADLVLEPRGDELVVRSVDGRFALPLLDFMGPSLEDAIAELHDFLPDANHTPRISIDRLVVRRESWRFRASELDFARAATELDVFVGARRWAAAHTMPRFVFATSPIEPKPMFVDFASPIGVRVLARLARKATADPAGERTLTFVEMLPGPDEVWLPDAEGERYTSELRLVAVDRAGI